MPALERAATAPSTGAADLARGAGLRGGCVAVDAGAFVPGTEVDEQAARTKAAAMFNARPRLRIGRGVYGICPACAAVSDPPDPSGRVIPCDHAPSNSACGQLTEGSGTSAGPGVIAAQDERFRIGIDRCNALDELARRLARIGGQHDLAHARPSLRVRTALDEEPLSG